MSSDYISRLRAELLRAGATQPATRRRARAARGLRPPAAAAAVALLVAALVFALPGQRHDERPAPSHGDTISLTYRVQSAGMADEILRERLNAAGISAQLSSGDGTLTISAPPADRAAVIALTAPGRFALYDWERSVLGPDGRPDPTDPAVTGGPGAGQEGALTEAEARSRAAKRPGARALEADGGWFALRDAPALTNADLASARAAEDRSSGDPIVAIGLTPPGQRAFQALTRELAQRGADNALGGDPLQTSQHFALVVDDRIISTPYLNWREAPDGIDGAGTQLAGFQTPEQARLTAALLSAGPLPGKLELIGGAP
jgi:preprotein translocase subunit SecD